MIHRCAGLVALVLCFSPLSVEAGYLVIQSDPNLAYDDAKCINGGDQVDVYVVYIPTTDDAVARRVQFKVPLPPCVSIERRRDFFVLPGIGSSENDVVVDFLGCPSAPIHILTIRLFGVTVNSACCEWRALSVNNYSRIPGWDCDGNALEMNTLPAWLSNQPCAFIAPNTPYPGDGSTIDSLHTDLTWDSQAPHACSAGDAVVQNVYFGTDSGALTLYPNATMPFDADNLLPTTTYYWRVETTTAAGAGPYPGPLWSFATPAALATRQRTWGAVKALYRR